LKKRKVDSILSPDQQQTQPKTVESARHRKPTATYGRCRNSNVGITAAKKLTKKAVYCIDNIDVSYTVEYVARYVHNQGIDVVSCFEVKPRHRRTESFVNDRKAFRLCINYDQRQYLLDPSMWPDSVIIHEWFFKSQEPNQMSRDNHGALHVDKRLHTDSSAHQHVVHAELHGDNNGLINTDNDTTYTDHADDDMDATIVLQEPDQSSTDTFTKCV